MDAVQAPIIAGHRRHDPAGARHHFAGPGRRALRPAAGGAGRGARGADRPGDPRLPGRRRHAARSSTRSTRKLRRENGIDVARGSARHGDGRRATWRSCTRCSRSPSPGDEIILPVPFYFNHEMAIQMAGCRAVRVPTDDRYQLRSRRHPRARSRRARARSSPSRRTTRAARCFRRPRCARSTTLCRERGLYPHHRRGLRVLHLRRGAARVAGRRSPARTRTRSRCTRCRRRTASPAGASATWCTRSALARRDGEESRTRSSSARRSSRRSRRSRRWRSGRALLRPHVRELADDPRHRRCPSCARWRRCARVPPADGAFYCLLRVNADADPMRDRRAADPRAQGRGDSRATRSA